MSEATSLLHEFIIDMNSIMHQSPYVILLLFFIIQHAMLNKL